MSLARDDRGVSETLGFIFVFALILSTVGLTFAVGYGNLRDARDVERINNAERAFDVFADNVDDVIRQGAPSRATELKLANAQLRLGDPVRVNVSVTRGGTTGQSTATFQPVVYSDGEGRQIIYANGAVFRTGTSGSAVAVRRSGILLSDEGVVIPMVQTRLVSSSPSSVGGTTTVLVRTELVSEDERLFSPMNASSVPADSVNVSVNTATPERAAAWQSELGRHPDVDACGTSGTTAWCRIDDADGQDVPSVYFYGLRVGVAFE